MTILQLEALSEDPIILGIAVLTIIILVIIAYVIVKSSKKEEFSYKPKSEFEQLNLKDGKPNVTDDGGENVSTKKKETNNEEYKIVKNTENLQVPQNPDPKKTNDFYSKPAEPAQIQPEPEKKEEFTPEPIRDKNMQWESDYNQPPVLDELSWDPNTKKSTLDPPTILTPKEKKQVEKLVSILESKKADYTAEQINKIIIEEKYSQRVAKEVVKRIYG